MTKHEMAATYITNTRRVAHSGSDSAEAGGHTGMFPSDDEIIGRVQKGDRELYLQLFERYYARVQSYARRQLQNPDLACDYASETFLRAYGSIGTYRLGVSSTYLCYLLQICRRLINNDRAKTKSIHTDSFAEGSAEDLPADSSELPLARILDEERSTAIRDALNRLPADDREIIHLAFERDLSRRDIGLIMAKPSVSAVTSHLYRAMQKLRCIVLEQPYFSAEHEKGCRNG